MSEKPKKKLSWKAWAGIGVAVIVIGSITGAFNNDTPTEADAPTAPAYAAPTMSAEESQAAEEAKAKKAAEKEAKKAEKAQAKADEKAKAEKESREKASTPEGRIELASGIDTLEVSISDGTNGDVIFASFKISDNLTKGFIATGAQDDTVNILKAVRESGIKYSKVFAQGSFPMTDEFGNTDDSMILNAGYEKSTVDKINFDGINQSKIWDLRDSGMVHPELQK